MSVSIEIDSASVSFDDCVTSVELLVTDELEVGDETVDCETLTPSLSLVLMDVKRSTRETLHNSYEVLHRNEQ